MKKFIANLIAFLTVGLFAASQVYIATNEKVRLIVLGYYESFIFFFIEQSSYNVITTACIIAMLIFLISGMIGKGLSVGIVYMVGIEISKEVYKKLIEASAIYEFTVMIMSWLILGIVMSVVGMAISEFNNRNKSFVSTRNPAQ